MAYIQIEVPGWISWDLRQRGIWASAVGFGLLLPSDLLDIVASLDAASSNTVQSPHAFLAQNQVRITPAQFSAWWPAAHVIAARSAVIPSKEDCLAAWQEYEAYLSGQPLPVIPFMQWSEPARLLWPAVFIRQLLGQVPFSDHDLETLTHQSMQAADRHCLTLQVSDYKPDVSAYSHRARHVVGASRSVFEGWFEVEYMLSRYNPSPTQKDVDQAYVGMEMSLADFS